jgi:hypothetical protein
MLTFLMILSLSCTNQDSTSSTDDTNTTGDDTSGSNDTGTIDTGDCQMANPPSTVSLSGEALAFQAQSATWSAPEQGCADTASYEVALGHLMETDILDWTPVTGTTWDGAVTSELPEGKQITMYLRAIDTQGNVSEYIASDDYMLWSPSSLGGLVSWYDWSDASKGQTSGCGETAGTGQMIGCMRDKSANANDLFQYNDGMNVYDGPFVGSINGRRAADFAGNRVLFALHNDSVAVTTDNLTLIWVDSPSRVDGGDYPVNKEGAYEVAYLNGTLQAAVNTVSAGAWAWGTTDTGASTGPQLNTFTYNGSTWTFRRNGSELGSMTPAGNQTGTINEGYFSQGGHQTTETPLVIGGRPSGSIISYEAVQGELLILEQNPSAADLAVLESYLMQKWGL